MKIESFHHSEEERIQEVPISSRSRSIGGNQEEVHGRRSYKSTIVDDLFEHEEETVQGASRSKQVLVEDFVDEDSSEDDQRNQSSLMEVQQRKIEPRHTSAKKHTLTQTSNSRKSQTESSPVMAQKDQVLMASSEVLDNIQNWVNKEEDTQQRKLNKILNYDKREREELKNAGSDYQTQTRLMDFENVPGFNPIFAMPDDRRATKFHKNRSLSKNRDEGRTLMMRTVKPKR